MILTMKGVLTQIKIRQYFYVFQVIFKIDLVDVIRHPFLIKWSTYSDNDIILFKNLRKSRK